MSEQADTLVTTDHGGINERLLRRYGKTDLSRIESAHRVVVTSLHSPEAKRLFMRLFHITQVHMHYISVIVRMNLEKAVVEAAEQHLRALLERAITTLDIGIANGEKRLTERGTDSLAEYQVQALEVGAKVFSSYGKRYLDLINRLDHLMLIVETMTIDEVIDPTTAADLKTQYKREVRSVAATTLRVRNRLFNMARAAADEKDRPDDQAQAAAAGDAGTDEDDAADAQPGEAESTQDERAGGTEAPPETSGMHVVMD